MLGDKRHVIADCAEKLKVTVLLKPFSAVKVTVEFPSDPALRVRLVELAMIVKSTTWNVIVAL